MMGSCFRLIRREALALAVPVMFVVAAACTGDPAAPEGNRGLVVRAGKSSTTDITVTKASPDSATQDTTLEVVITGSGFVSGATAEWQLGGAVDPGQVRTNSTRFVNSRQLVANITISATASIGKWDIAVTAAGSKGGIGTEAFTIKARGNPDTDARAFIQWQGMVNVAPDPTVAVVMAPAGIAGDNRDRSGQASTASEYQGRFCGVNAKIFWDNPGISQSGDLVFDPDMDFTTKVACGSRRTLNFYLSYEAGGSAGAPTSIASFAGARQVMQLEVGQSRTQAMRFWYIGLRDCDKLAFDSTIGSGTSDVRVTRLPDVNGNWSWRVESQYPHLAMCTTPRGWTDIPKRTRYLPFAFTATEVPNPYPSFP